MDDPSFESMASLQRFLLGSLEGVTEVLKTIGHPKRLETLVLLLKEPKGFGKLLKGTNLKKTALANHLTQLIEKGLVERYERGQYRITQDGQELLEAAATTYRASVYREQARQEQIRRQREASYKSLAELIMDEKLVTNEPIYQSCWISYLGAVSGVLKSLGKEHDIVDVGGSTGYAFWISTNKETTCPSAPTALGKEAEKEIHTKGMEGLGVKARWIDREEGGLPQGCPHPLHDKRARKLFDTVKEAIKNDQPVIFWGVPAPEWGIVKGYRGQSYLVSTFRHLNKMPEDPVKYNEIQAPGMIAAQVLEPLEEKVDDDAVDKRTIERAIRIADGPIPKWLAETYIAGPAAYRTWASHLEQESTRSYMGNSYMAVCFHEGKAVATEFLSRMAQKYESKPQASFLVKAAAAYGKVADLLKEFTELFPFAFEGEMPQKKCKKGSESLLSAEKAENEGVEHLKTALAAWE